MNRLDIVLSMIPPEVETILDIGSRHNIYKDYKTTTLDCIEDADINQDLNKNQILPLEDNSFDMIVANQLLEHLGNISILVKEMKRVSKKYIFIGLPNEITYGQRIKILFGIPPRRGYSIYGHKHFFTYSDIEKFINTFFGKYKSKKIWFACSGTKLIPRFLKNLLIIINPSMFGSEFYYLIEKHDIKRGQDVK